jgi:hypothetical protein
MVDYIGLTYRNLVYVSSSKINHPLKAISFIMAIFFITCFTVEIIFSYIQVNSLYLKDKSKMSPLEKDLKEVYYEGLDKESIKESWWVRNYNLIFTARFMLVCLFIYTFQNLQILQVGMSCVVLAFIFVMTFLKSIKLKFFKSKFTKIVRVI